MSDSAKDHSSKSSDPRTQILVAIHKPYWKPDSDLYLPIQVGQGESLGFTRDNTGDNIADKNWTYCELTAVYWAWKNLDADIVGLSHYRRYFQEPNTKGPKKSRILTASTLNDVLLSTDVVLPKVRNYWIESNWSQYAHSHSDKGLVQARKILAARYPQYLPDFDKVMKRTWGHRFNMFVMRRAVFETYCEWLFDVLAELESHVREPRIMGFVAERLLDVWIEQNQVSYRELSVVFMEKENWFIKGSVFLGRKLRGFLPLKES